jgi:hypothetical protein
MGRLAIFLALLVVAAVGGLFVLVSVSSVKELPTEVAKSLLQVAVVGVAGHVVSALITKANNERQDLLRADELRSALLNRLNEAFIDVKKVRRLARATSKKVAIGGAVYMFIPRAQFHDHLQAINDAQLDLELVSKDVESSRNLFVDADQVIKRLDMMEEYLNGLIDEYEHSTAEPAADPVDCFSVASFPRLSDLLGSYKTSDFRTQFVHTYYANLESVRQALFNGNNDSG